MGTLVGTLVGTSKRLAGTLAGTPPKLAGTPFVGTAVLETPAGQYLWGEPFVAGRLADDL